jgi:hypothetical protein
MIPIFYKCNSLLSTGCHWDLKYNPCTLPLQFFSNNLSDSKKNVQPTAPLNSRNLIQEIISYIMWFSSSQNQFNCYINQTIANFNFADFQNLNEFGWRALFHNNKKCVQNYHWNVKYSLNPHCSFQFSLPVFLCTDSKYLQAYIYSLCTGYCIETRRLLRRSHWPENGDIRAIWCKVVQ